MKYPNFEEEKILWEKGFKYVAGLDEAGRGSLSGPVVAGAVAFKTENLKIDKFIENLKLKIGNLIKDSKLLSQKQREEAYEKLIKCDEIVWGIGVVSEKVIDKINILEATKLAMQKAVKKLKPCFLLIDGNFKVYCATPQRAIVKGDQKVMSIAMASIIAKVTRDRIMLKYHKKYPQYGFDKHKGYGTELHTRMLKKHGACKIHRKSFFPVSETPVHK